MTTLFATFHHLAVLILLGCALLSIALLRQPLDVLRARLLRTTDMVNGIAATLVLLVGLIRVVYLEKGAHYYFHNGPFLAKLALYGMASVLSLVPTLEIVRWRAPLKQSLLPTVRPQQLSRMRKVATLQLVCIVAMMACAHLAASGFDWSWTSA